ncbi:MAG: hypothetical protein LBC88_04465 [Spirochaetaceae bacterium]|nr:hypothetical protein [Spirochaetaceae bacterium]
MARGPFTGAEEDAGGALYGCFLAAPGNGPPLPGELTAPPPERVPVKRADTPDAGNIMPTGGLLGAGTIRFAPSGGGALPREARREAGRR